MAAAPPRPSPEMRTHRRETRDANRDNTKPQSCKNSGRSKQPFRQLVEASFEIDGSSDIEGGFPLRVEQESRPVEPLIL